MKIKDTFNGLFLSSKASNGRSVLNITENQGIFFKNDALEMRFESKFLELEENGNEIFYLSDNLRRISLNTHTGLQITPDVASLTFNKVLNQGFFTSSGSSTIAYDADKYIILETDRLTLNHGNNNYLMIDSSNNRFVLGLDGVQLLNFDLSLDQLTLSNSLGNEELILTSTSATLKESSSNYITFSGNEVELFSDKINFRSVVEIFGNPVTGALTGSGSPIGFVSGLFSQEFYDLASGVWYKCNSIPAGTSWDKISI